MSRHPNPERIADTLKRILEERYDVALEVRIREANRSCFFCASEVVISQLNERKKK